MNGASCSGNSVIHSSSRRGSNVSSSRPSSTDHAANCFVTLSRIERPLFRACKVQYTFVNK